ncbi:sugar kinase [Paracoccus aerius]
MVRTLLSSSCKDSEAISSLVAQDGSPCNCIRVINRNNNGTRALRFLAVGECMIELSGGGGPDLWRSGFAGDTLNTAWYARALLPSSWSVDYDTCVGTDPLSDRLLAFIASAGIGTQSIVRHPSRAPGLYMIELKDGERSFTYWRDSSAARTLADDPQRLKAAFDGADVIYFSGITIAILAPDRRQALFDALDAAKRRGARLVFDPNLRPRLWPSADAMCRATTAAAARASILLPSFDDEAAFFGDRSPKDMAKRYLALGADEVLVKNGGAEMVLASGSAIRELPAMESVTPVDTTGAGDSFNGSYLAARLAGAEPEEAARKGHKVAMQVVMHRGP